MISRNALANILFYLALGVAAVCGTVFILLPELREKESLRAQRDALVATNNVIEAETARLFRQRTSLESDNPDALIHAAHASGLSMPNEVVLVIEENR